MPDMPSGGSEAALAGIVAQLVARNQMLVGHLDKIATAVSELAQDARARQAATTKALTALRSEMQTNSQATRAEIQALRAEIQAVRAETAGRFDAGSHRLDDLDERAWRAERALEALRSKMLRLEDAAISGDPAALDSTALVAEPVKL